MHSKLATFAGGVTSVTDSGSSRRSVTKMTVRKYGGPQLLMQKLLTANTLCDLYISPL